MVRQGKKLGSRQNKKPKYEIYTLDGHDLNLYEYQYYKYLMEKATETEVADHAQDSDNKKAANNGGHTVQELAPGYKTESGKPLSEVDEKEFILKSDGSKDFGEITDEIATATKGELLAAPIRLQVGNDEFGYKHLCGHASQMKQKGYDVMDYINHILENFNQVYDQRTEKRPYRFVLYCKDDSKGFMPLDITLDKDGDFYTIVSTMPHRAKIKGTLLFDGSANPSASTTKGTLLEETSDNGGTGTSPNTHGKNNVSSTSSVAQGQESGKKNISYTDGRFSDKSKDNNAMRGTVKNGIMTIWRKGFKKKDTSIITISVDEANEALKKGSANSEYTLHILAEKKIMLGQRNGLVKPRILNSAKTS